MHCNLAAIIHYGCNLLHLFHLTIMGQWLENLDPSLTEAGLVRG
jgi:hypothetical protein